MKNDYQKYLETQSKNLDDWENIANQSLEEKTIDNLKKNFDGNLEKKILYTEDDVTLENNHAYARGLKEEINEYLPWHICSICLLYTSPSPRDSDTSRMPSSA